MKRIVLVVALIIINMNIYAAYYVDLAVRPALNLASTLDNNAVKNNAINNLSLGVELGGNLGYLTAGAGIEMNNPISFTVSGVDGTIKTMPYYAYARFNLFPVIFKPYLVGKFGINKVMDSTGFASVEGGSYWAAGFGIDVYNFLGEVTYQNSGLVLNGTAENLSQIQLVLGIKVF